MGESLENLIRGAATGAASTIDFFGAAINRIDTRLRGAGLSDGSEIPTFNAAVYRHVYPDPDAEVPFWSGYVPRIVGGLGGKVAALGGLAGLGYLGATATAALLPSTTSTLATILGTTAAIGGGIMAGMAIPTLLGAYGAVRMAGRYVHDSIWGEKNAAGQYEKASLSQGFWFGFAKYTNLPIMHKFHGWEIKHSGRGLSSSHIESSITSAASPMRRNFRGFLGSTVGSVAGIAASGITLFALPVYRTIKGFIDSAQGNRVERHQPAHAYW